MKFLAVDRNSILRNVTKKIHVTADIHDADAIVLWSDIPRELNKLTTQSRYLRKPTVIYQHGREATVDYTPEGVNPQGNNFGLIGDIYLCWGNRDYRRMVAKFGRKRVIQTGNPEFDNCLNRDIEADKEFLLKEYGIPKNKPLIVHAPMHYFIHNKRSEEVSERLGKICKKNGWTLATSVCSNEPMGTNYSGIICANKRDDLTERHINTVHALNNCASLVIDEAVVTFSLYALAYDKPIVQVYMGDISKDFPNAINVKEVDKPCDHADVVKDLDTLEPIIKDNLDRKKYVAQRNVEFAETIGVLDGKSTERFVDAIYAACEKKVPLYAAKEAANTLIEEQIRKNTGK